MKNRHAFTLIEMLIVVAMIAIVSATTIPKLNYTAYRLDAGARGVRAALQRAQAFAVSSQHDELVAVDVARGRLYVVDDVNNNLAADPGERITTISLQDGAQFTAPATTWAGAPSPSGAVTGSTLSTITVNGSPLPSIVFRCDGAASSDMQIYLTSRRLRVNDWRGVSVIQATGRVDWYKDAGGIWSLAGF
jgi:prepilin-type N-terminal cleavage/methylation domain-containing protein